MTNLPYLPVEIWEKIIGYANTTEKKAWQLVNRICHKVIQRQIIQSTTMLTIVIHPNNKQANVADVLYLKIGPTRTLAAYEKLLIGAYVPNKTRTSRTDQLNVAPPLHDNLSRVYRLTIPIHDNLIRKKIQRRELMATLDYLWRILSPTLAISIEPINPEETLWQKEVWEPPDVCILWKHLEQLQIASPKPISEFHVLAPYYLDPIQPGNLIIMWSDTLHRISIMQGEITSMWGQQSLLLYLTNITPMSEDSREKLRDASHCGYRNTNIVTFMSQDMLSRERLFLPPAKDNYLSFNNNHFRIHYLLLRFNYRRQFCLLSQLNRPPNKQT
jgi:hypothetical protein